MLLNFKMIFFNYLGLNINLTLMDKKIFSNFEFKSNLFNIKLNFNNEHFLTGSFEFITGMNLLLHPIAGIHSISSENCRALTFYSSFNYDPLYSFEAVFSGTIRHSKNVSILNVHYSFNYNSKLTSGFTENGEAYLNTLRTTTLDISNKILSIQLIDY